MNERECFSVVQMMIQCEHQHFDWQCIVRCLSATLQTTQIHHNDNLIQTAHFQLLPISDLDKIKKPLI